MLTPEELLRITDTMYPLLDELNTWITKDLIRRLMARMERGEDLTLSATDQWQIQLYKDAGGHYEKLTEEIQRWTKQSEAEVAAIFEDAGLMAWNRDDAFYVAQGFESIPLLKSESLMKVLTDAYRRTNGEIRNYTSSMAESSEERFVEVCDTAHLKVMSGAQSYSSAVAEAVEELVAHQTTIAYPSGHVDTIETAVLRAVRTGTAQASGAMTLEGMEEHGWDVILVSAHLGARYGDGGENPGNHAWWQGKHYSRTGATPDLPLFEVTGYGTGEGLSGWNCRHSFGPGTVGHNPYEGFDSEENKKAYDLSQKQRAMERAIRQSKSKLIGYQTAIEECTDPETKAALREEYDKITAKLSRQNSIYNQFCEDNGLKRHYDRVRVAQWNRSKARQAAMATKKAEAPTKDAAAREEIPIHTPSETKPPKVEEPVISISSAIQRQDVTQEYIETARPGTGEISFDPEVVKEDSAEEIATAEWIRDNLGGDIRLLKQVSEEGKRNPDYLWREKLWDQKTSSTAKSANSAIQIGLKQIRENPGGVILDFNINKNDVDWDELLAVMDKRMQWYHKDDPVDLLVILNGGGFRVIRYTQKKK